MAWVTTLGPAMAQIDYRLQAQSGCSLEAGDDTQVAYRLESDRPLEWIGEGLREVGIEPGTVLDDAGKSDARALANGRDPHTGTVLVAPKMAVDPRAKLPAGPLVAAVRQAAERSGTTPAGLIKEPRAVARYGRLQRGVAREQTRTDGPKAGRPDAEQVAHRAPVGDLQRVADAADISLDDVYDADVLAVAREHADARVPVGNRGYDLTLDLPKSYSVLTAMADPELAGQLEDVYLDAVRETVAAVQQWAGYGMRGHHGDGHRAERVDGTGLLGWMTVHRTARPVAGQAPDPHLHAHVTFLNMVRGTDGKWSTIGAGGRDIHRHAHAADSYVKARLRQVTTERWGMQWERDPGTGAWEVAAVPAELRTRMSKRAGQVAQRLQADGVDAKAASTEQAKTAAATSREAKRPPGKGGDLRAEWHAQAVAAKVDPAALVAAAMPGPQHAPAPVEVSPHRVAEWVFRTEDGLTGHRKVTSRADVLAAVMDAVPAGVNDLQQAEQLVDQVLADDLAVPLPATGAVHLSNSERFTTADIVDAERTVLAAARDRYAGGLQVVPGGTLDLAVVQFEAAGGFTLSAEQRAVLARLAGGGHGVDTVVGVAGAGKTTIMAALRSAYEANGKVVAGASTAAVAAANLQTEAGITSRTIASWLIRIDTGPGLTGVDVLVIDEAAMVDDRHLARLLTAAGHTGTKVVAIGDPKQLRAVGVGGTFAAVHTMLGGLELTENRRQRDVVERQALAVWRTDERRAALQTWAGSGRVHVTGTPEQAHTAMLAEWVQARAQLVDGHDAIARLLMLAHTNADVDALNAAVQARRHEAGQLGPDARYALRTGGHLTVHVGDTVMTRTNDRGLGVLNGQRGIITAIDGQTGRLTVERRHLGPDGPELVRVDLPRGYLHDGGVQLAYAITAAKAQGLTGDVALVYGNGMDAHVLYPAMSRDRERTDLWLALDPLETDADRARHGPPGTDAEARQRAVDAYAASIANDRPDGIVLAELDGTPQPITARRQAVDADQPQPQAAPRREPVTDVDALAARVEQLPDAELRQSAERDLLRERLHRARLDPAGRRAADEQTRREILTELRAVAAGDGPSGRFTREQLREGLAVVRAETTRRQRDAATAAGGRAEHVPAGATTGHVPWQQRPYGTVATEDLPREIARAEQAAARTAAADAERQRAEQARLAEARAGHGPAMRELEQQREQLAAAVDAARQAEHHLQAAQAHQATARQAREQIRALQDAERGRSRVAKMLRPRTDEVDRQVRHLADVAVQADHQVGEARAAAYPHGQLVRRTPNAAERLAELQQHWPTRAAEAIRADEQQPHTPAILAAQSFPQQRRQTPEALLRRAAGLRDEAQLREGLNPGINRIEDTGRQERADRQARAEQAARRAEADRVTQADYDYDYHRHGPDIDRGGPSLGM